ncbi:efflux RND transporter periplasmic adaptor subunit [Cohnella suwonensis]|uniref:Efflux RND transporter periplasmic adaptor subunit n=1 Tax=Cohnella suwonensis TaxID=696072 RepID=A0ABW0LRD7_9BACL
MKRKSLWIAGLVVVLAAGSWGGYAVYGKKDKQLAATLNTTQVRKGTLEVKVSGTGTIQPYARETLKSDVSGTVAKVNFKEGDTVKKGDVLATFEEEDNSSQVKSKQIDIKKKKLELGDLQTKYKEAADDESRESIALNIQKQQLDIELAEEDLDSLQDDEGIDPLVAPIGGVLSTFDVAVGDSLNPNAELGEIVDFSKLQMVVGVDELDIPKVKVGQTAKILVEALPENSYAGKVVTIADEGTSSNGVASFDVTVELETKNDLKVGMSAEASIMTAQKADALYVPVAAVQSSRGKYYVMVPGSGTETENGATMTGQGGAAGGQAAAGQGAAGQGAQSGQGGQSAAEGGQTGQQAQGGQAAQGEQAGQGGPAAGQNGENASRFQNMTEEERAAMREQFMAARENGGTAGGFGGNFASGGTSGATTGVTTTSRVEVEVGINNEDYIEIVSGLKEGDLVVLPTVASSSSSNNQAGGFGVQGLGAGGLGGAGAFPGGAGGFGGAGGIRQQSSGSGAAGGGR